MVLLLGLSILTGCQGLSTANASNQPPSSTLSLGVAGLDFGSVAAGTTKTLNVTAVNSGTASITISGASISTKYFTLTTPKLPVAIAAGQSATMSLQFAPNAAGAFSGTLTVTSDATNTSAVVSLSGTGTADGQLTLNPSSENFGSVTSGSQQSQTVTLTNTGGESVDISQVSISGTGFQLSGITTPLTLNASQAKTFTVTFAPQTTGSASGTVTISSNASNPTLTMSLSGTGVSPGSLTSNPTSLNFGSVTTGTQQSQTVTLTNTGGTSVVISQASISGTGFQLSGITTPLTLNASQTKTFTVTFAPQTTGSPSGTVTISSNATNPTLTVPLSGTAVSPGALTSNPTSLNFGSVTTGTQQSQTVTLTNTGGTSVVISQASISGTGFQLSGITTPLTLNASQTKTFTVTFAPQTTGSASGTVTISSNASNPTLTVASSGTGVSPGALTSNPTSLNFGSVTVGTSQSLSETITNTGGTSVTVSQASVSGTGFTITGITTPLTLAAGNSTTFTVKFTPSASGSASGNVTITSTASNPTLTIPLSGTGSVAAGQLSVSPATLNLGSVVVGNSGTASGTLTASGAAVTVTAASSNNSVFSVGGLSLPVTINSGQSIPFSVTFSPTVAGAASATLTFTSNAQPSTTTESLTGTGTAASSHSVDLSWNASTSSDVSGYNVYRSVYTSACGSFSKINALLNASTVYTDTLVVNGTSYCYATTAVDSSNQESGYSNIVSNVQIPIQ